MATLLWELKYFTKMFTFSSKEMCMMSTYLQLTKRPQSYSTSVFIINHYISAFLLLLIQCAYKKLWDTIHRLLRSTLFSLTHTHTLTSCIAVLHIQTFCFIKYDKPYTYIVYLGCLSVGVWQLMQHCNMI